MDNLGDFQNKVLSKEITEWQRLFDLIPLIEDTKTFGEFAGREKISEEVYTFPYVVPAAVIDDFFRIVHELDIVPVFDWTNWTEGRGLLNDQNADYSKLDIITLCKLITVIVRADRFNEGFMVSCFKSGIVLKILKALSGMFIS